MKNLLSLTDIADAASWRWKRFQRYLFLISSFRNGASLAFAYRSKSPSDRAICWDGMTFIHPSGQLGLSETLLEIWYDQVYTGGFYQPSPGDVVIDAGANVGLFAIWLARQFPSCRILAFEPFSENYRLLCRNVESSHVESIRAFNAALSGRSGKGQMERLGERSLDHRLIVGDGKGSDGSSIELYSLRDALELTEADQIALFKIDIEGSERELFEEASEADIGRVDRFAIEYHDTIRPGTMSFLRDRLGLTHTIDVHPSGPAGYGMLYARLKEKS